MAHIVLLALAAAVFPLLIACVAIMVSRPHPRPLLLAFYAGGLIVSLVSGSVLLAAFNCGNSALGNSSSGPNPATSIVAGLVALALSWLMASRAGRERIGRWRHHRHPDDTAPADKGPSRAEKVLAGAGAGVAFVIGAAINLPGPYYVLALGDIAKGDYSTVQSAALIVLFNVIMFTLLEVPLVGYLVNPRKTAEQVARLSAWLNANGLRLTGWLIGAIGIGLVVQGVAAAVR